MAKQLEKQQLLLCSGSPWVLRNFWLPPLKSLLRWYHFIKWRKQNVLCKSSSWSDLAQVHHPATQFHRKGRKDIPWHKHRGFPAAGLPFNQMDILPRKDTCFSPARPTHQRLETDTHVSPSKVGAKLPQNSAQRGTCNRVTSRQGLTFLKWASMSGLLSHISVRRTTEV